MSASSTARAPGGRLVRLLLRPAIRLALRSGILLQDLIQLAKEVYVEVAEDELLKITPKVNVSRLSVMTGVHRQDVTRIFKARESLSDIATPTLLGRVIATWGQSPRYCGKNGRPRVLSFHGAGSEFWRLVQEISTTINPGTLVFELVRNGAAQKTSRGLQLVRQTVAAGMYPEKTYELLAKDIDTLTRVAEENISHQEVTNHAHYRTEYDNIILREIPAARAWIIEKCRVFHREVREYLSKYDADYTLSNVVPEEAGGRLVVCSFSYASPALFEEPHTLVASDDQRTAHPRPGRRP